jgi:hypothetical protein
LQSPPALPPKQNREENQKRKRHPRLGKNQRIDRRASLAAGKQAAGSLRASSCG